MPSHDAILAAVRRGDEAACRELGDLLYPQVISIIRNHLPKTEDEQDLAQDLGGQYRSSETLADDPYLRKFLTILAEEHYQRALELKGIANGAGIFEDMEETPAS